MGENTTTKPQFSVIIPVYDEAANINSTINHVAEVAQSHTVEIIVCDGGPGHETIAAIETPGVITIPSKPGRGIQLNTGAAHASGEILLFLHADTRLPSTAFQDIAHALSGASVAGAFSLAIDSSSIELKIIAWFANLRSRLERLPYGDQAHFVRTAVFRSLGGYAPIPIMEDVAFFKQINRQRLPISILAGKVTTSSRRWDKEGMVHRTLTNWWLRLRYAMGARPEDLVRHYRPHDSEAGQ
ncbi:TIGR04283 family arsenosugar biosynthesis glycosyltransferase [Pseudodesulfovibrio piezophilus]|uniref:Glycosyl transferase family 2 n=1 Tax=Pseudodesulfovibrio piezophilus (strain DSM 21447 / JCM 15486 / C1TLV30) TaxID=1322246 RepID=M1WRF2_PSEP2|nr:TIGR04283 family arsenosugar biosynthesis glycosyltransferase [Pseudodesulfovibrio piezophilus]CCH48272.1 Glycosyl transferase family 2 [Pseudodesulfovibrio piezophilus C1TLV30]